MLRVARRNSSLSPRERAREREFLAVGVLIFLPVVFPDY
jgi:hypothetical protein